MKTTRFFRRQSKSLIVGLLFILGFYAGECLAGIGCLAGAVLNAEAALILPATAQAPIITNASASVVASPGGSANFWVAVDGAAPLSYKWYFNGTAIGGANSSTLTLNNVQVNQAGTYTVSISNSYGAILSSGFLLNVTTVAGGGTVNFQNQVTAKVYNVDGTNGLAGSAFLAQLYAGLTTNNLQPVGATTGFLTNAPGRFLGGTRVVATVAPGQAGWFQVRAWESAYGRSYEESVATGGRHGVSTMFQVTPADPTTVPPGVPSVLAGLTSFALQAPPMAQATVTLASLSHTYNGSAKGATVTTTPAGLAVAVTYNGSASLPVNAGSYTVVATVASPNYAGGATNTLVISKAGQAITFNALAPRYVGEGSFALGASASSGLPVSYNSSNLAVLSVSGATATVAGAGATVVTATQPGNGNYLAALPVSQPLAVGPVVAWGDNTYGQGETPPGLTEAVAISSARFHNVALRSDGTVAAWGRNDYGQTDVPATVTNAVAVAAGGMFSAALQWDGRVAVWGGNGATNVSASATNVVGISAGLNHVVALRADGTVVAWGVNSSNQCAVPSGLGGVVAVAAGYYHSLALKADGTVVGWGSATSDYWAPPVGLSGAVAIVGGMFHSAVLKRDGTVVCWGANTYGQSAAPGGLSNVVAISAGYGHTAALKADGTVVCWGLNNYKQSAVPGGLGEVAALGAGYYHTAALLSRSFLTPAILGTGLVLEAGQSAVLRVAEGCWRPGSGQWRVNGASIPGATNAWYWVGQAQAAGPHNYSFAAAGGSGAVTSQVAVLTVNPVPAAVTLANLSHTYNGTAKAATVTTTPAGLPTSVTYNGSATLPVNAGSYTVVARVSDPNYAGAATNTLVINKASQTIAFGALASATYSQPSRSLTASASSGLAVTYASDNAAVATVSGNTLSIVGVGTAVITAMQAGNQNYLAAPNVEQIFTVNKAPVNVVLANLSHTYDGGAKGATVTTTPAGLAVAVTYNGSASLPVNAGSYTVVATVASPNYAGGATNTLVISKAGQAITFNALAPRYVGEGSFALGASASSGLPVSYNSSNLAVLSVSGATATVAGAGATVVTATQPGNGNYLAALPVSQPLAVGPVVAWGDNTYGQGETPPGLTEAVAISSARFHNVALRSDGTVAAWGRNDYGQTDVPATVTNAVAVAAGGMFSAALQWDGRVAVWGGNGATNVSASATNVVGISAGLNHVVALRADGTVVAWGVNSSNQCAVPSGLGGVVAVAAGYYHSLALKADGTVVGWGSATSDYWAPPVGLSGAVAIVGGMFHSAVLKRDGTVVCWGANTYGQSAAPGGLSNVVAISAGYGHTAALKADGTVVCWGLNNYKQSAVPGGLGEVAALGAGYYHTAALLSRSFLTPAILGTGLVLEAGQSAVLRVAEGCWRPGSGQWRVNGASIPGATNAWYWVGQAQAAGPHNYSFAAAGGSGAVTSQVAVLTVNPVPAAVTLANLSHTYNGTAKAATVTTTPAGLPTSVTYNGSATLPVNAGSYTVVARVSDPNYAGAATNTLVINKASQTIAFGALATKYIDDAPFTLTGTASSGLPVSYTSGNHNVAMIQSNLVILTGIPGASVITASQPGDANYLPASSVTRTLNVIGVAPSITVQPRSQTNIAGATVTLTVGAAGSIPLRYQWFRSGQPIAGATNGELWLTNVTQADSGGYHCVVTNVINSAGSAVAWLVVIPPEGIMVVRTLPASYKPGEKILVELTIIIATAKTVYGVEDQPPVGWTISNPSGGVLDTNHHKVKFGPFYDSAPRSFTYEVTVPMDEHNVCEFVGSVGFEKIVSSITGDSIIGPLRHPADLNPADFVMTLGEAIAYGHAWKLGESWPEAPTTIDIDYATRAAAFVAWR